MKFSSEVCKKHLDASVSLFYWTQQPSFTPQWLTTKPPVTAHEAMCRLCGASAWPRKSSYPARDFSRGSPYTRGYFTGIPGTYSEAPAGYPQGFGITCGRYCMRHHCTRHAGWVVFSYVAPLCSPYWMSSILVFSYAAPLYSPYWMSSILVFSYAAPLYSPCWMSSVLICSTIVLAILDE